MEAFPQVQELIPVHVLDLVGGVASLEPLAERPALDGLGQNHCGRLVLFGGRPVGGVDLLVVVAAPGKVLQVLIGEVLDQGPQAGIGTEEVVPDVVAAFRGQALVLTVHRGVHLV